MNIVTLLPSATEIVCALGLQEQIVGVSHSCNFPETIKKLPAVTSTRVPYQDSSDVIDNFVRDHLQNNAALYDLDIQTLNEVRPDVVVSQTLCDVCAVSTGDVVAAIYGLDSRPRLIDLQPNTLDDVYGDILRVAAALGRDSTAASLLDELKARQHAIASRTARIAKNDRPRVAFLEWLLPPFCGGHWNPELVELAGGIDLLGNPGRPSATLSWDRVAASDPDVIVLACCGFDVERALEDVRLLAGNDQWQNMRAVQNGEIYLVDGDAYFARPGPRLIDGLEMLAHALHPDIHPPAPSGGCVKLDSS